MIPIYNLNGNSLLKVQLSDGAMRIGSNEFRGATFDLEGTMVNTDPWRHKAHRLVAEKVGVDLDLSDPEQVFKISPNFYGGPGEAIMQQLASRGNGDLTIEQMLELDTEYYRQLIATVSLQPREGVVPFLERLKNAGIDLAMASNTSFSEAEGILHRTGLWQYFKGHLIVLRDRVTNGKPHPEIYEMTAALMGIRPQEQAVFEDSPVGVKAAFEAGSYPIGIPLSADDSNIRRLFDHGARLVVEGWQELNSLIHRPSSEGTMRQPEGSLQHRPVDGSPMSRR